MLFQDVQELKSLLEIAVDDDTQNKQLNFLNEYASGLIEEVLNRDFTRRARTQYYDGTGTRKLLLRSRPVYTTPTIEAFEDDSGFFGTASGAFDSTLTALTYNSDFGLQVDQDDGTSRSGILVRFSSVWSKPSYRQKGYLTPFQGHSHGNVKIVYTAGWTVDTLPAPFRLCAGVLVSRLRHLLPIGLWLTSESYEERSVSYWMPQRDMFRGLINEMLGSFRNWRW